MANDVQKAVKRARTRTNGSRKRLTESALENFMRAFNDLGGHVGLVNWARKNKTEFYRIYAKRLPAAVEVDAKVEGNVSVEVVQFTQPEPK